MLRNRLVILSLLLFWFSSLYAQENKVNDGSINKKFPVEGKSNYEERLKRFEKVNRLREKDPKRFMDSINRIKDERLYGEAIERIEFYKNNPDLSLLKEIDLSNARITSIPSFVYKVDSLEVLVLDNNSISELPKELGQFEKLKRVYWRNNQLDQEKRIKINKIGRLEKLDLSGNALRKLPKVHRINSINELILEKNNFSTISLWRLRKIKGLKELELSQNPVEMKKRWYGLISHLEVLKLNKCRLQTLDPSLFKISGLKELQVQVNEIENIPEGISGLTHLTKVSFYKNRLKSLPNDFYDLKQLRVLDLYYNELTIIPDDIARLQNLRILYLSFNRIYDLSSAVGNLEKLSQLYIHHNRLSEMPVSIERLDSLSTFHFQENYINEFPHFILNMKQIKDLDISFNDIKEIPLEIETLDLKSFYWRGLEINFNDPDNYPLGELIQRLDENGVIVSPKINMKEFQGEGD